MELAEEEARKRGCHMAYVDTFDFQPEASTKNWATGSTASWATMRIATPAIIWLKACNAA